MGLRPTQTLKAATPSSFRNDGDISSDRYIHDGDEISLVFDGAGEQLQRYLHGPQIDQVLAQESADGEVQWALADHQGSVRDVVDNDGQVVNHVVYDSFGQITEQSNPTAFFRFSYTGREFDPESEQYYYRARYFDPSVGRFISEDPIGFSAQDTNLSRYVFNNPVNFTDPRGLFWNYVIGAGLGAGLDLGIQLFQNGGDFSKVDWWSVAASGASGAIGVGITAKAGTIAKTLTQRALLSGAAGGSVDTLLKLGTNAIQGKCLNDGLLESFFAGGLGAAGGELLPGLFRNFGRNTNQVSSITTEAGLDRVAQLRAATNAGKGRNIAFANFDVDGQTGDVFRVSGAAERPGQVPLPETRQFDTTSVGGFDRSLDSEAVILENFAEQFDETSQGTIDLFSERPICESCQGVVEQFRNRFEGIDLRTNSGPEIKGKR